MIDPSFADVTDAEVATVSQYGAIANDKLQTEIDKLKNDLEIAESRRSEFARLYQNLDDKVRELEQYIKDNFAYIDEEVSQRIVEIFGLEITQEYDVEITVTFTGTVQAPLGFDMDTVEDQFEFRADLSYYNDGINADLMEDRVQVDWSEN